MKHLVFIIMLYTMTNVAVAQNRNLSSLNDSLKLALEATTNDSLKAEILVQLAEAFLYINPDSVIYYGKQSADLAKKSNNIQAQMGAEAFIGQAWTDKGNLPKALQQCLKSLELGKDLPSRIAGGLGPTYFNLGTIYLNIGDYKKAILYFNKMTALGDGDLVGVAYGYVEKARIYHIQNEPDSAMVCLDRAYHTFARLDYSTYQNVYDFYAAWYILRAKVYFRQNKPDRALRDLFTTLKTTLKNGQLNHTSNIYNEIAGFYKQNNQPDSAIYYAEKGLAEANKISYSQGVLDASKILAELFEGRDYKLALHYFKLATQTQQKFYGAGNVQVLKDMIRQDEIKQNEIESAKIAYQNRLQLYLMFIGLSSLFVISFILLRNNRQKHKANILLQQQKKETEIQKKQVERQNEIIHTENRRKSEELEEARQMQLSMLPKEIPQPKNLDIAVYMKTATEVGGDYYDFSNKADGSINIAIGDATGHGMKAGVMVSLMKSIFTTNSPKMDIEEFFNTANNGIKSMRLKRMMMGFTMLNINRYTFKLINAGLPPIFLFCHKTGIVQEIQEHTVPIGAMNQIQFNAVQGKLEKNDVLLLLTDGMPELLNAKNEMYGYQRFRNTFEKIAKKEPEEIIDTLKDESSAWVNDQDPDDDVTFVVIKVK